MRLNASQRELARENNQVTYKLIVYWKYLFSFIRFSITLITAHASHSMPRNLSLMNIDCIGSAPLNLVTC